MRFLHSTGRLGARHLPWYSVADLATALPRVSANQRPYMLKRFYEPMVGWSKLHGTLQVRFEDLTGDSTRAASVIESVAEFLDVPSGDAHRVLRASLQSETITKSDGADAARRLLEPGGRKTLPGNRRRGAERPTRLLGSR